MSEEELCERICQLKQENEKLEQVIKKMANEIFIEYNPHFASPEAVIEFFMNTEKTRYCSGSTKERASCQEEKMGCVGCNYYTKKVPHKPEKGIIRLWK